MKAKISILRYIIGVCGSVLILSACQCHNVVPTTTIASTTLVKMDGTLDAATDSVISFYRADMNKQMCRVIGQCDEVMEARRPEANLSRFAADAILSEARKVCSNLGRQQPVMSLLNTGGLRATLHKGSVTVQSIFEISPFENTLVVITLSGEQLRQVFEHVAERGGEPISGAKITIGGGMLKDAIIDGEPLVNDKEYLIATNSYLAAGGDGFKMLKNTTQYDTGLMVRDLLIEYVEALVAEGRHMVDPGNVRVTVVE